MCKCGRGSVHRQHVAIVLHVAGNDERLDLNFVLVAVGATTGESVGPSTENSMFLWWSDDLHVSGIHRGTLPAAANRSR